MRIYVASSWRNERYEQVVRSLRAAGHDVYDFRDQGTAFRWAQIDPAWQSWTPEQFREALEHPLATDGFEADMTALVFCEACVLVEPAGRSAHLELGFAAGVGKRTAVLLAPEEPELMYAMADALCIDIAELVFTISAPMDRPTSIPAHAEFTRRTAGALHDVIAALGGDADAALQDPDRARAAAVERMAAWHRDRAALEQALAGVQAAMLEPENIPGVLEMLHDALMARMSGADPAPPALVPVAATEEQCGTAA